jgi:hypothetical protein
VPAEIALSHTASRPSLGPTQLSVQEYRPLFPSGETGRCAPSIARMHGAIPTVPHEPLWRGSALGSGIRV